MPGRVPLVCLLTVFSLQGVGGALGVSQNRKPPLTARSGLSRVPLPPGEVQVSGDIFGWQSTPRCPKWVSRHWGGALPSFLVAPDASQLLPPPLL